jgi:hypothetical protein
MVLPARCAVFSTMARVSKSTPRIAHNPVSGALRGRPPLALGFVSFCFAPSAVVSVGVVLNSGFVSPASFSATKRLTKPLCSPSRKKLNPS